MCIVYLAVWQCNIAFHCKNNKCRIAKAHAFLKTCVLFTHIPYNQRDNNKRSALTIFLTAQNTKPTNLQFLFSSSSSSSWFSWWTKKVKLAFSLTQFHFQLSIIIIAIANGSTKKKRCILLLLSYWKVIRRSLENQKQTDREVKSSQHFFIFIFCLGGRIRIATDAVCRMMRCISLSLIALHAHIALCSLSFTSRRIITQSTNIHHHQPPRWPNCT